MVTNTLVASENYNGPLGKFGDLGLYPRIMPLNIKNNVKYFKKKPITLKYVIRSQLWAHILSIPALRRWRQEDHDSWSSADHL